MSEFEGDVVQLKVNSVEEIAREIFSFELVDPNGQDLPEFSAGAHVSIQVPNGEIRKYSLCNDPMERNRYVIAVKRETKGTGGSLSLTTQARPGDLIRVSAPRNDFSLAPNVNNFLFIAGGIGITPILSMMRYLKSSGAGRFKLYYLTRAPEMTAFREELLAPEFRGTVEIHHDNGDPDQMLDLWPILETPQGRHLYCCGPRPLMEAVRDMSGHWSSAAVHFEDFGATKPAHKAEDRPFKVTLARTNRTFEIPKDLSILDTLRADGIRVSSSCESGTCGSCRTRLISGDVEHRDLVLTEQEHATNIMICVSRAREGDLVIDL